MGAMSVEEVAAQMASLPKPEGRESAVEDCVASPDGSWLASIAYEERPILWTVATGREGPTIAFKRTGCHSVQRVRPYGVSRSRIALSRDGHTMAWIGDSERAEIWNARQDRDDVGVLSGYAISVAISPSGAWIAVGQRDGLILVYDAVSRIERAGLRLTGEVFRIDWHPSMPSLACVDTAAYCYVVEVFIP